MLQPDEYLKIAEDFALCLDHDDYLKASLYLDESTVYEIKGKEIVGVDSILESYRSSSVFAKKHFDSVDYESRVEQLGDKDFLITYTDNISKDGVSHTYKCQQIIRFNDSKQIQKITHQEIPGFDERLTDYFESVGVKR